MQNIEIKTPIADLPRLLDRLHSLGARHTWTRRQRDTFFQVERGWLKLRVEETLEPAGDLKRSAELISYRREPGTHPRPSDYDIAPVADPETMATVLTRSLGVRGVVEKTRRLFRWRHTRIHQDEVSDLGSFLEIETIVRDITPEAATAEVERVIEALALRPEEFLDRPYLELLGIR